MQAGAVTIFSLALLWTTDGLRRQRKDPEDAGKAQDCFSKYDGMPLLELKDCTSAEAGDIMSKLQAAGCTILDDDFEESKRCSGTGVVCSKQFASELDKKQLASMLSPDAGAHFRQSSGATVAIADGVGVASDFYTAWRDLDAQSAKVESLVNASGGLATLETVGRTLQGRDMRIVRFRGAGYSSGKTRIFVTYNMHAREWITGMSGVYQVEQLIEKLREDPSYLAETEVVVMPMANPDGFVYSATNDRMHRKNMRQASSSCYGVDLNRNWDAQWNTGGSSGDACSDTYHGTSRASEPETNVMASVMDEAPTTVYIDVHAYSQLIISSYGYTTANNPRSSEYRAMGSRIQSAIRSAGGNTWTEGPIAQVLYSASGSSVDYADKKGALGVCFELRPGRWGGGGFAPPTSSILPGAQESYAGFLAAIDYAMNPPAPPAPTPAPAPGSWVVEGSGCTASGNCVSSNNHPSNYGNGESCSIQLGGSVAITVDAFNTESSYDILTVGGSSYSGTSGPQSGSYSGTISWSSDYSVTKTGWKLCKA